MDEELRAMLAALVGADKVDRFAALLTNELERRVDTALELAIANTGTKTPQETADLIFGRIGGASPMKVRP